MNSCYGCTERHIGCHGECEKYEQYCAENAKLKEKITKSEQYDIYAKQYCAERRDFIAKHRKSVSGLSKFGGK
jgi:hypothetical protein